jgi:hypothetical protein
METKVATQQRDAREAGVSYDSRVVFGNNWGNNSAQICPFLPGVESGKSLIYKVFEDRRVIRRS